jgi:hypothetical protein
MHDRRIRVLLSEKAVEPLKAQRAVEPFKAQIAVDPLEHVTALSKAAVKYVTRLSKAEHGTTWLGRDLILAQLVARVAGRYSGSIKALLRRC